MRALMVRACIAPALFAGMLCWGSARAQEFLNQEWLLDPANSSVYMVTVKDGAVFETQQFMSIAGNISSHANANIRIDLESINSGIDLRDTRLRFQLFETFKSRYAQINAQLDKDKLKPLLTLTRLSMPLAFSLSMHGHAKELQTDVWVTRISETTVSVSTIKPIIVEAESFGLTANIAKLVEAIGGTPIAAGVSITFDLLFKSVGPVIPRNTAEAGQGQPAPRPGTESAAPGSKPSVEPAAVAAKRVAEEAKEAGAQRPPATGAVEPKKLAALPKVEKQAPQDQSPAKTIQLGSYSTFDGKCQSLGLPPITISVRPKQGTVDIRQENIKITRQITGSNCIGTTVPGRMVYYVTSGSSAPTERVVFQVRYLSSGKVETRDCTVFTAEGRASCSNSD